MNLSLLVLGIVFLVIAFRKIGGIPVKIWQAMLAGATFVLFTGQITLQKALQAIDLDVMVFLFGMFVVGEALIMSGYLNSLASRGWHRIHTVNGLVAAILIGGGLGSAILMNDTLAIVGTPLMLRLARENRLDPRLLLMALALAITTGSVMSPIGNPQNLLIAIEGPVPSPFITFVQFLALPTFLSLALAFVVLRVMMPDAFHHKLQAPSGVPVSDPQLARLARWSVLMVVIFVGLKMMGVAFGFPLEIRLSAIAVTAAVPLLLLSPHRVTLLRRVDWPTLVFFASLFVLMASVWQTGLLQEWTTRLQLDLNSLPSVLGLSLTVSQLISNVPLVALYLPLVEESHGSLATLMALAAGSTIAGNLFILGAASNVIIIQRAEQEGQTLSFWSFARSGIPLTCIQMLVYGTYLHWAFR